MIGFGGAEKWGNLIFNRWGKACLVSFICMSGVGELWVLNFSLESVFGLELSFLELKSNLIEYWVGKKGRI